MAVISEDSVNEWIVPHLSRPKRGTKVRVKLSEIVSAIIYRLKTGCQWRQLRAEQFFRKQVLAGRAFTTISGNG